MLVSVFAIASGGALGALARYGTVLLAQTYIGMQFPYGTLLVNSIGAFIIGFFMSFLLEHFVHLQFWYFFVVVGFLGGYTTFSSFAWETCMLYREGDFTGMCLNIILNNTVALMMVVSGIMLGKRLSS